MISNSDMFYSRAKEYQDKRKDIIDDYEARMKKIETARGSQYFDDESKKAEETRDKALTALKGEYTDYFNIALDAMRKANNSRGIVPPTEEELRIIQMLKLKDKPTEQELEAAARTLKGNATCLSILTEMAHKAGYIRDYMHYSENKEFPIDMAEDLINGLAKDVKDFLDYDSTRAARIVNEHNKRMYGERGNAPKLAKRRLFDTKEDCFDIVGSISGDNLEAFLKAIDE